ncbi:hypothetical protein WN944_003638 [Citrus x changshan-huyou]|uniref:Uncharacterized protein n=1 Tax=Citrus x changshan-huyou TaxID=2935761 RepID=A0AAP0QHU0_9ROSI
MPLLLIFELNYTSKLCFNHTCGGGDYFITALVSIIAFVDFGESMTILKYSKIAFALAKVCLLFMKHPFLKYHTCITFATDDFLSFLADLGNGMFKYHTYITFATNDFLSSLADLDNGMFKFTIHETSILEVPYLHHFCYE